VGAATRQWRKEVKGTLKSIRRLRSCTVLFALAASLAEARQTGPARSVPSAPTGGAIEGTVRRVTGEPVARAVVRLRDLVAGVANTITETNADGQFHFAPVPPGQYLVELIEEQGQVRAVSNMLMVPPGGMAIAEIVLPGSRDPFGALFWKSSAAILTTAAAGGILGYSATGRTASPER